MTSDGFPVLYPSGWSSSENVNCIPSNLQDPFGINTGKKMMISKSEDIKRGTILDCSACKFATITCNLIPSDMSQVNVSLILWKPTFIKAHFSSLNLTVRAELQSENATLVLSAGNQKRELAIQISKDGLPGRVPLWVILLSAFAGLLLLMLLILALWKIGFFKRPLKKKMEKWNIWKRRNNYSIILRFASNMWQEINKRNQRHSHITLCNPSGISHLENNRSSKIQKQYRKDIFYKMLKNIFK